MKSITIYYPNNLRDIDMEQEIENAAELYEGFHVGSGTDFTTRDVQVTVQDENVNDFLTKLGDIFTVFNMYDISSIEIDKYIEE